jgi:hypothetical protein
MNGWRHLLFDVNPNLIKIQIIDSDFGIEAQRV